MAEETLDSIIHLIDEAAKLYYRLVVLAAPSGSGKTALLRDIHRLLGVPIFNVNVELSREMLELTGRQRVLHSRRVLSEMVGAAVGDVVLLDNIEVLFDVMLQQNPLRLLQELSRNLTVVAAWNGTVDNSSLVYASPEHREHRRYPVQDFLVVQPETAAWKH